MPDTETKTSMFPREKLNIYCCRAFPHLPSPRCGVNSNCCRRYLGPWDSGFSFRGVETLEQIPTHLRKLKMGSAYLSDSLGRVDPPISHVSTRVLSLLFHQYSSGEDINPGGTWFFRDNVNGTQQQRFPGDGVINWLLPLGLLSYGLFFSLNGLAATRWEQFSQPICSWPGRYRIKTIFPYNEKEKSQFSSFTLGSIINST